MKKAYRSIQKRTYQEAYRRLKKAVKHKTKISSFTKDDIIGSCFIGEANSVFITRIVSVVLAIGFTVCFCIIAKHHPAPDIAYCWLLTMLIALLFYLNSEAELGYLIWMENYIYIYKRFGFSTLIPIDSIRSILYEKGQFVYRYWDTKKHGLGRVEIFDFLQFMEERKIEAVLSLLADADAIYDIAYQSKLNNKHDKCPAELYIETRSTLC